jgi:hypothetical protein
MCFFWNHWKNIPIMVLYEGPKRTCKGKPEPEVCWWIIEPNGSIHSYPARNIRKMDEIKGFSLNYEGKAKINTIINKKEDNENV